MSARAWAAGLAAASLVGLAVPAEAAPAWCHVVRHGESLGRIARQAGTSAARLRQLNGLDRGALIRSGDVLALPLIAGLATGRLVSSAAAIPARRGHRARENAGADADRLSRIPSRAILARFVRAGLLVPVPPVGPGFKVVDVEGWRRVARPWTRLFLYRLGAAMNALFGGRLRVTDITRTEAVQLALGQWNANAAPARGPGASTHLTGAAVDLSKVEHTDVEIAWLRVVLRRLTERALVDAIEEFAQPHFHVLVRRAYAPYGARLRTPAAIGC
jgi:murein DD-endopeptidase MepM/ murein hydrolase activator NlpD